jgi:transposase
VTPPRRPYASDLTDAEWQLLAPFIPAPKPGGRPALHDRRELVNAMACWLRAGCAWRLLPHDLPPWQTVDHYFRSWRQQGLCEQIHRVLHLRSGDRDGAMALLRRLDRRRFLRLRQRLGRWRLPRPLPGLGPPAPGHRLPGGVAQRRRTQATLAPARGHAADRVAVRGNPPAAADALRTIAATACPRLGGPLIRAACGGSQACPACRPEWVGVAGAVSEARLEPRGHYPAAPFALELHG